MFAGRASALIKYKVHVIILIRHLIGTVIELHAIHHLGFGDGLTRPVTIELLVGAVPGVVVYVGPIVRSYGRILQEHGNLVGLKCLIIEGVFASDHTTHVTIDEQTHFENRCLVNVDGSAIGHLCAIAGGGGTAIEGID